MPECIFRDDLDENYVDGVVVSSEEVRRFVRTRWEPLQIRALFTPQEWSAARTVAADIYESLTFIFDPIDVETVVEHLRGLVGPVLTAERFTEITGRAV